MKISRPTGYFQESAFRRQVLEGDRSNMPGLVRISFGCYNTRGDVDHLLHMLERICAEDLAGDYALDSDTGTYLPRQFDMVLIHKTFSI